MYVEIVNRTRIHEYMILFKLNKNYESNIQRINYIQSVKDWIITNMENWMNERNAGITTK